jgi:hypothetical protein
LPSLATGAADRTLEVVRRAVRWLGVALVASVALAGCNGSLSKRELVVHFTQTATPAEHQAVLTACAHAAPNTSPEPMTVSRFPSDQVGNVRFRIDHADDRDLSKLIACLNKQHGVVGVDIPD